MSKQTVGIIGAGIIGSAIAHTLSERGVHATIFDGSAQIPGATKNSFGWINAHNHKNPHHFKLRLESMELWRGYKRKYSHAPVRTISTLDWDIPSDEIDEYAKAYNELGYESEVVGHKQILGLVPNLKASVDQAILCKKDAVAMPELIAEHFLEQAISAGAQVRYDQRASNLITRGDKVIGLKTDEAHYFDEIVVAAGCGSRELLQELSIALPMNNRPGLLFSTTPHKMLIDVVISAPDLHFWQKDDGRLLIGENQAGDTKSNQDEAMKMDILQRLTSFMECPADLEIETCIKGVRPQPEDGMPVMGRVSPFENLHIAVMHSGITLAPIVAKLLAENILYQKGNRMLDPYRLGRFDPTNRKLAS